VLAGSRPPDPRSGSDGTLRKVAAGHAKRWTVSSCAGAGLKFPGGSEETAFVSDWANKRELLRASFCLGIASFGITELASLLYKKGAMQLIPMCSVVDCVQPERLKGVHFRLVVSVHQLARTELLGRRFVPSGGRNFSSADPLQNLFMRFGRIPFCCCFGRQPLKQASKGLK
jgi:hypothetical protein